VAAAARPATLESALDAASLTALASDRLPAAMVAAIGAEPATVFPWEIAYGAANPIDLRPMPVFQTHNAGTARLDRWNAAFFEDDVRAPRSVIFEWHSIDYRHPLVDVPATTLSLWRWYDFAGEWDGRLLLRRRDAPRFGTPRPLETRTFGNRGGYLEVPRSDHPVLARLRVKLSLSGTARKLLYKIPEVRLTGSCESGRFGTMRITPETLENPLLLSGLPFDRDGFRDLLARGIAQDPLRGILITGPGAADYEDTIEAEFYELPELRLERATPPLPDPADLEARGRTRRARVESINGLDAAGQDVIAISAPEHVVAIQGFAVDEQTGGCAAGVGLAVGGQPSTAVYGIARPDIAASSFGSGCATSGFLWGGPTGPLGRGVHELSVQVIAADGKSYLEAEQKVRFRVE
jgi:hypothetical protein